MDRNHRLDAPNNESLGTIEQLNDHSNLSGLYFSARKEWEGKAIISDDERQSRQAEAQLAIALSIRPWFIVIGTLVPLPVILFIILSAIATTLVTKDNAQFALLPIILGIGLWFSVSFFSLRRVHTIFYDHAIKATPFAAVLVALVGLSAQASFLLTRNIQNESFLTNTLIVSAGTLVASIVISGLLLIIWTSPRLTGNNKVGGIVAIALLLLATIFASTLL